MPWFLNPRVYERLPLFQNPELYLFLAKVLATALFARMLHRRGVRGARLVASAWLAFYGLFVTVMLSMHAGVIVGLRLFNRPAGTPFVYDFHLFSLVLLAAVLVPQGVRVLRALRDPGAAREALRPVLVVLAVAVALIPIQFFGMVLTVFSMVSLVALTVLRPRPAALPGPRPARSSLPLPR